MSSYTSSLGLELITPGSQAGLWGNTTNNTFTLVDQAITGVTPISFASASGSTYTLTDYNGAVDEARSAVLNITGTAIGGNTVVIPNKQKTYLVRNNTGQDVTFQTAVPTATYTVGAGYSILIFCDGNNNVFTGIASPSVGTLSVAGGGTGTTTFLTGGFIKSSGGTSALTASQYVALGSEVSGTLPVGSGGTGVASITANGLVVGAGTSAVTTLVGTSAGNVPTWNGTAWIPVTPTGGVTSVSASLPLSSSGGTTPNISLTGQVGVANGGTGVSTFAAGFVKSPGLASNLTTVTSIDLSTSDVSGTLTVGRGGTGAASLTSSALLVGNGTGSITTISPGANGAVLTSNGSSWAAASLPSFVTAVSAGTGITVTGTTNPTITNAGVTSLTAGANITITGGSTGALTISATAGGTGTVTSVSASGGTTGLSFTGSPITSSGTLTLGGTLAVASGGTNKNTWTNGAVFVSGNVFSSGTLDVASGGTGSTSLDGAGIVTKTGTQTITGAKTFQNNVNINFTPTTTELLNLYGAPSADASSGGAIKMGNPNAGSTVRYKYLRINTAGAFDIVNNSYNAALGSFYDDGSFYLNTGSGKGYQPGGGSWTDSSDERLKTNVNPLSGALATIIALQPKSFDWKYNRPNVPGVGFIAQEVQQIIPTAVSESNPNEDQKPFIPEGEKVLNIGWQNDMIAYLVGAIKELKAEVDALKAAR